MTYATSGTPAARQAPCVFCGTLVDTRNRNTYQRVHGWARRRAGGTNALACEERENVYACGPCVESEKRGWNEQPSLFESA